MSTYFKLTSKSHNHFKVSKRYSDDCYLLPNGFKYKTYSPELRVGNDNRKTYSRLIFISFEWLIWIFSLSINKVRKGRVPTMKNPPEPKKKK